MPRLMIDSREVSVAPGATILQAARTAGIEIPTLCFLEGCTPAASCMVCVVKVRSPDRFLPSCAAAAEEGMTVESETDEVRSARRRALELLLSDHLGDCLAPCQTVCPAHMQIPAMLRQAASGQWAEAAATARDRLVLPATLGRICPAPCEKGCRRADHDAAVAIRLSHRAAAEADLAAGRSAEPAVASTSGKRVAVVGAGPAGLAAAWRLLQLGHAAILFDEQDRPGGALRSAIPESRLPPEILDAEIGLISRLGAEFRPGVRVGRDVALADLARHFDAVLVACGEVKSHDAAMGLETAGKGLKVNPATMQTGLDRVFAAGGAVHPGRMAVRAIAEGQAAAHSISEFLAGRPPRVPGRPFTTRLGRLTEDEMASLAAGASAEGRTEPAGGEAQGLTPDQGRREAARCLHCDCRKADSCRLRYWADVYGARPGRHPGTRRPFQLRLDHPDVVYEPGKCIACGLCVQVTAREGEALGLALHGRGFGVKVDVPLEEPLSEGLRRSAAACVAACPTGALAFRDRRPQDPS